MYEWGCVHRTIDSVFFFKQKTAYEMRISDWSSDVCSSDLLTLLLDINPEEGLRRAQARGDENRFEQETLAFMHKVRDGFLARAKAEPQRIREIGRASCRERVCQYG